MTGVATISGSTLVAVFESTGGSRKFSINRSCLPPTTALHTWSNRQRVYTAPPDRNAGTSQIVSVGGTLVVGFITDEDFTIIDAEYTPRTSAKATLSCDQGGVLTWGGKLTVGEVISVWPGPAQVDESTLLMIFDHNGVVALATHAWLKISQEKDERLYKA